MWAMLLVDQLLLLLVASLKFQQFEMSEFAFRSQLEHRPGQQAALLRAIYKQLPGIKALRILKAAVLFAIGVTLFAVLTGPVAGTIYALLSAGVITGLSRLSFTEDLAEKAFSFVVQPALKAAHLLKPLWAVTGLPPKKALLLPGSLEEFNDQLRRLPSTVMQPLQRQRLESILMAEEKTVKDIMTPKKRVITVEPSATLGPVVLADLEKSEHGYFPIVTKKGEPEGILTLSDVSDLQIAKQRSSVRELMSSYIAWVEEDASLFELISTFLEEKQYIVLVRNQDAEFSGIVTLADVMRSLIGVTKQ